jgi:hypothetical protein
MAQVWTTFTPLSEKKNLQGNTRIRSKQTGALQIQ